MLVGVCGTLALATGCSDDGGTLPIENTAPVANFAVPSCTINVPCGFVSTSTDDAEVMAWSWDLDGDGDTDATTANTSFTYATAGDFEVSLTVHDAEDLSQTKTSTITIAPVDPVNTPPTAGFEVSCSAADCSFTNTSTDEAPGIIAAYAWHFGDGETSDVKEPTHAYTVAGPTSFTITLIVTDDKNATGVQRRTISVAPPNTPPTADFNHFCSAADCRFTSTSIDEAPGTIASYAWDFGDGATSAVSNPFHRFAVTSPKDFTVKLTVTDNNGATDIETKTITVSPPIPGAEGCTTKDTRIDCLLNIANQSIIKLKLIGVSCTLKHQRVVIPPPSGDQVFLAVCTRVVGDSTKIFGGFRDRAFVFEAGSQATIRFIQGTADSGEPTPTPPAAQLTGSFPTWTINFEDGANPGAPGEPDFTDVVLLVEAVPPAPRDLETASAF